MPPYFKPLRRKLGVVTLVMACVFMGLLVRGDFVSDFIDWGRDDWDIVVANDMRSIGLMMIERRQTTSMTAHYHHWYITPINAPGGYKNTFRSTRLHSNLRFLGCAFYLWRANIGSFHLVEVNQMSLIAPLTLISAWLLLSKPRGKPAAPKPVPLS